MYKKIFDLSKMIGRFDILIFRNTAPLSEIRTIKLVIKNKNKLLPLEIGDTNFSPFINKYFAEYVDCLCLRDISSERLCKQQLNSLINSFSLNALFLYKNCP